MSSILKALEQLERDRAREGVETQPPVEPQASEGPQFTRRRRQRRIRQVGAAVALVAAVVAGFLGGAVLDRAERVGVAPPRPSDATAGEPAGKPAVTPSRRVPVPPPASAPAEGVAPREPLVAAPPPAPSPGEMEIGAPTPSLEPTTSPLTAALAEKPAGPPQRSPSVRPAARPVEAAPAPAVEVRPAQAMERNAEPAVVEAIAEAAPRAKDSSSSRSARGEVARADGAAEHAQQPLARNGRSQPVAAPAPAGAPAASGSARPLRESGPAPSAPEPIVAQTPLPGLEVTRWHPAPERRKAQVVVAGRKQWVGQADRVSGFQVLEITPSSVVLERGEEVFRVRVGAQ